MTLNILALLLVFIFRLRFASIHPLIYAYIVSFYLLNVIGSIIVFFPQFNIYGAKNVFTEEFFFIMLLHILFSYTVILLPKFTSKQINYEFSNLIPAVTLLGLICTTIIFLFYRSHGWPPILQVAISGGNSVLIAARSEFFATVDRFWFYRIGFYVIPQILGVLLYVHYRVTKRFDVFLSFLVCSLCATVLALGFLHKTPAAMYWIGIFIAKFFFERRLKLFALVIWTTFIFGIFLAWYFIYFPGQQLSYYLDFMLYSMLNRVFGVYPLSLAYVPIYLEGIGLLNGATMLNPFGLLPYEVHNLSQELHILQFGIDGAAPAPAIGYGYADFGYFGVLITSALIFSYLIILDYLVSTIRSVYVRTTIITYFLQKVIFFSMVSAPEIIWSPGELITHLLVLTPLILIRKRREFISKAC